MNAPRPPIFWRHFGPGLGLLGFWGIIFFLDAWLLEDRVTSIRVLMSVLAVYGTIMTVLAMKWRLEAWRLKRRGY